MLLSWPSILNLGSLVGIADLFQGQGVAFTELNAPFRLESGLLKLEDAKAYGPSVGFTLTGEINRRSEAIAMKGNVIPVYALNSFFGGIPLLGTLLSGSDGEVIGISYGFPVRRQSRWSLLILCLH